MHPPADRPAPTPRPTDAAAEPEAAPLEQPTGGWAVRGPTAFVIGLMLLVGVAATLRTCLA